MIDFDKTCAACGGMVADYGPEHGWMHIVSQYDNAPHDVVLSDEPEVCSPKDKSGDKRHDHLPECDLSEPCDNGKPHDMNNSGWNRCYRCEAGCECDRLHTAHERGVQHGLCLAKAAVERSHDWYELSEGLEGRAMMKCDALAAIDALRNKP